MYMDRNTLDPKMLRLVLDARNGDRESLGQLAQAVEGRLMSYIYRVTLDYDLAHELCQQTLVTMVESLSRLRQPDRFWFWLFRTAMGQVQHHYREQQRERKVRIAALDKRQWEEGIAEDRGDGLDSAARVELTDLVVDTIMQMRLSYRNVLVLRCFEQMSYAQIGELLGCKELRVRVLFFRALRALKLELSRQGIARTALGVALGLFGLLTSPSKGVTATVTGSSLDVGVIGSLLGMLGTKMGVFLTSLVSTVLVGITFQKVFLVVLAIVLVILAAALVNLYIRE